MNRLHNLEYICRYLLEYGVGFNTPTIIRFPFERMAESFPDTTLIRVNTERSYPQYPLGDKFIALESLGHIEKNG